VRWTRADPTWYAAAGHLVAWDEIELRPIRRRRTPGSVTPPPVEVAPRLNLWRAPTDNDGFKLMPELGRRLGVGGAALQLWQDHGLGRADPETLVAHRHTVRRVDGGALPRHVVDVPESLGEVARVGVTFDIPQTYRKLRWHGRGPHENYPDRNRSAMVDVWEREPDESPYLVPQEFGLRTECRWFEVWNPTTGDVLRIDAVAPSTLHVSATWHAAADLYEAATASELHRRERLIVCVDVAHRGLGTASCGPDVLSEYRVQPGRHDFSYVISGGPAPI